MDLDRRHGRAMMRLPRSTEERYRKSEAPAQESQTAFKSDVCELKPMVTIHVVKDIAHSTKSKVETATVAYEIDKELICSQSPFFAAAFNGPFLEGQTQTMMLEDVNERVFIMLMDWLYSHELKPDVMPDGSLTARGGADLLQFWVLAGRFIMPELQNQIMPGLYLMSGRSYFYWLLSLLRTAKTSGSDTLKELLVFRLALMQKTELFKELMAEFPLEWMPELACGLQLNLASGNTKRRPVEDFFVPAETARE